MRGFKKFAIVSSLLFTSIMILSLYILNNCSDFGNCGFVSTQVMHFIFISIGLIGTTYCLLIVKHMDEKIDKDLIKNYNDLLEDTNKKN